MLDMEKNIITFLARPMQRNPVTAGSLLWAAVDSYWWLG
jgi:hypothetical protein